MQTTFSYYDSTFLILNISKIKNKLNFRGLDDNVCKFERKADIVQVSKNLWPIL